LQHTGTQQEKSKTRRSDVNRDWLSTISRRDLEPISLRIKQKDRFKNNHSSMRTSHFISSRNPQRLERTLRIHSRNN
jgi:hypothetical protein